MKKGLYLHFDEVSNPKKSGIRNKIEGQLDAFRSAGFETDVIYFYSKKELFLNDQQILRVPSRQLTFRYFIFRKILKICQAKNYAFIYIRYAKSDPYFLSFVKGVNKTKASRTKIFIEFPTFPYDSEMDPKNAVERLIISQDKRYRKKLHLHIDYAVSTVALTEKIFHIPTFRIDNGVDLDKVSIVPHKAMENEIRIIGVANLSRWHAWDRVIKGLHDYVNQGPHRVRVSFRIIGAGKSYPELLSLRDQLKMQEYVEFSGPMMGKDLDLAFDTADLAMGTLGLHRIGLASTSVLKLREYTARGLPTVIGYDEPVISNAEPFILKFPPNDSPLNIGEIVTFYEGMKLSREEIRNYAENHFSWSSVLKPVLEKI